MSEPSIIVLHAAIGSPMVAQNGVVWPTLAVLGWIAAVALGVAIVAGWRGGRWGSPAALPAPGGPMAERSSPAEPSVAAPRPAVGGISGVLRWLFHGTEADAVACLEMRPGRGESLWVEPRGLAADTLATLTRQARDALLGAAGDPEGAVTLRWLGVGGPRVLVALRATSEEASEALRFGRYQIEWVVATGMEEPLSDVERRVRAVRGVAWAEVDDPSGKLRLVLSGGADRAAATSEVRRELGPEELQLTWIDAAAVSPEPAADQDAPVRVGASDEAVEPRLRLVDVAFTQDGQATADVRVTWKGHELRGRGHAQATPAGPYYAGAKAVADAIRPLLDSEVVVEGLYQASTDQAVPVLIAEVRFEGEPLVGAVVDRKREAHWAGARAVLDAVNRRLVQVAGRSGRI